MLFPIKWRIIPTKKPVYKGYSLCYFR
jgi:hypothetical protein